jgi:hypothetical protein
VIHTFLIEGKAAITIIFYYLEISAKRRKRETPFWGFPYLSDRWRKRGNNHQLLLSVTEGSPRKLHGERQHWVVAGVH